MNGHPPGRPGDCSQASQRSKRARTRASPRGAASAGLTTLSTMRAPAILKISSWRASFDRKWANRPLLDIWRSSASRPIVRPSKPIRVARPSACVRIASRVCSPLEVARAFAGRLIAVFTLVK